MSIESNKKISSDISNQNIKKYIEYQIEFKKHIYDRIELMFKEIKPVFSNLYNQTDSIAKETLSYLLDQNVSITDFSSNIKKCRENCRNIYTEEECIKNSNAERNISSG